MQAHLRLHDDTETCMTQDICPCGSQHPYSHCCKPFHSGSANAPTAAALMRSRYSAFVKQLADYLIQTHHPGRRQPDDAAALEQSFRDTTWLELVVMDTKAGGPHDSAGTVEFVASYCAQGKQGFLHERSRFVREDGRWFYVDGEMLPLPTPGRNDPCWCGSGRKFKKCHG